MKLNKLKDTKWLLTSQRYVDRNKELDLNGLRLEIQP